MKADSLSHAGAPTDPPARGGAGAPFRILVVDADSAIRNLSTEVPIHFGYRVDAATDGAADWETLQRNRYDLLVTDSEMPKVTGVEWVKKLRAARMDMPVILASVAMPNEELSRYPWLQFAATRLKPFTSVELLETVKKILRPTDDDSEQPEPRPL